MLRAPSVKTLEEAFPGKGKEIRALLKGESRTSFYSSVRELTKMCLNPPRYSERLMCALDEILEGYGTEVIWGINGEPWPVAEYVNMGDTYSTTIMYDHERDTVQVTSFGDWVARNERRRN